MMNRYNATNAQASRDCLDAALREQAAALKAAQQIGQSGALAGCCEPAQSLPEVTIMGALYGHVVTHNKELHSLLERLATLRERLFGPTPEEAEAANKSIARGAVAEIADVIERTDALLRACHAVARNLERLA